MIPHTPDPIEFASLTARLAAEELAILRTTRTHTVYRVSGRKGSYILKWFFSPEQSREPDIYRLLEQYHVPTLPVFENSDRALVLEDLLSSSNWRLAEPTDMACSATGAALAAWYRTLHAAGREALSDPGWPRYGMQPWVEAISVTALENASAAFNLGEAPAWRLAFEGAPVLKARYLALPQTFNYHDFAAENLALSRDQRNPLRAIVFDYDCFTTGAAYSDWRNVMYSLQGKAREAFQDGYGPCSEEERLLDGPLSTLYGLVVASQRGRMPAWACPLIGSVFNGELENGINEALEAG
jgi:Phosphotransferase enzyme family